jgi:cell division protein FtsB
MKITRPLMRLLVLVALLAFAGWRVSIAYQRAASHADLRHRVAALADQKSELEQEHAQAVERGQKLQTDPQTKLELLKQRMGYSQRDEIPIVVQIETPDS